MHSSGLKVHSFNPEDGWNPQQKRKKEHLFSVPSHPPHPSLVTCYKTKKKKIKSNSTIWKRKNGELFGSSGQKNYIFAVIFECLFTKFFFVFTPS